MGDSFKNHWVTRDSLVFLELIQFFGPLQSHANPHPGEDPWGGFGDAQR